MDTRDTSNIVDPPRVYTKAQSNINLTRFGEIFAAGISRFNLPPRLNEFGYPSGCSIRF